MGKEEHLDEDGWSWLIVGTVTPMVIVLLIGLVINGAITDRVGGLAAIAGVLGLFAAGMKLVRDGGTSHLD